VVFTSDDFVHIQKGCSSGVQDMVHCLELVGRGEFLHRLVSGGPTEPMLQPVYGWKTL